MNQYNNNGEKHGPWEVYYDNGQLYCKGTYVNGDKHGIWEYYWDNRQIQYKGKFVNNKPFIHGSLSSMFINRKLHFKFIL